jgi:hypothetical protein
MTLAAEREADRGRLPGPDSARPGGVPGAAGPSGLVQPAPRHRGHRGVLGYLLGHWLGNVVASGYTNIANSGANSIAVTGGLLLGVLGWLVGIGALNYPLAKMVGMEPRPDYESTSWTKYLRYTADHKVVGLQYVIGVLTFFFTGGLLAMAIRTELLSPTSHIFGPGTYIAIVSEHGTIMMMMATSVIVGPLGNWLIPLMIGARRTAFPRVEAFSFWVFSAGYFVILSALFYGGFPTGWTGYAPLQTQAGVGMMSYLVGFAVIGLGMMTAGFNLAVTIINYRAPGMTWSRIPIFVWSILATCALLTLATPTWWPRACSASSTTPPRPPSTSPSTGAARSSGRTSSGSSATPRCTSWPCPGSASWPSSSRCSPESHSSPTRWRRPAWSGWPCCRSSSGSTTCSRAGSTRTCARCSC